MQTAGFEPARARARSRVLTNRPTRRRGRVARIELGIDVVHSSISQYKICMVKSHTNETQVRKRNPEKSPSRPRTNDRGTPDFPGPVLSLLVWVAFFHPSTAEAWRGLAMGNQICSQIPLRIIVARGNSYSGIIEFTCIYIFDYLLGRISTDPPRWACEKFWKSVMSLANRAPYEP